MPPKAARSHHGARLRLKGRQYGSRTFKVLPGEHTIGVKLNDTSAYPGTRFSKNALPVVFSAEAGKAYVTRSAQPADVLRSA